MDKKRQQELIEKMKYITVLDFEVGKVFQYKMEELHLNEDGVVDPGAEDCSGNLESEDNQCHTPPAEAEKEARAAFDEITGDAQANSTPEQGAGSMPAIPRNMLVIVGSILIVYGAFGSGRRFG